MAQTPQLLNRLGAVARPASGDKASSLVHSSRRLLEQAGEHADTVEEVCLVHVSVVCLLAAASLLPAMVDQDVSVTPCCLADDRWAYCSQLRKRAAGSLCCGHSGPADARNRSNLRIIAVMLAVSNELIMAPDPKLTC